MEKKDELTPEEYRKKAQEQIQNYKHQWKIFSRTGIVILAAVIAIIIACIAWFVSNNKVTGSGIGIRSAGSDFELAADAGADPVYQQIVQRAACSGGEEDMIEPGGTDIKRSGQQNAQ